jgi:hypothetical protein
LPLADILPIGPRVMGDRSRADSTASGSLPDCLGFAERALVKERYRYPIVNQTTSHGQLQLLQ